MADEKEDAKLLPDCFELYDIYVHEYKEDTKKDTYSINFTNFILAAEMMFNPVTFGETLYIYNKKTGLYTPDPSGKCVKSWVDKLHLKAVTSALVSWPETSRADSEKKSVTSYVMNCNVITGNTTPFNKFDGIPCENCVLKITDTGIEQLEYTPEMMYTRKLPTAYNPDANVRPLLDIFNEWVSEEYREYLAQIPGQALLQSRPDMQNIRKAYLLIGEHRGGKSTYIKLLKKVFGEGNVSGVALQNLDSQNFLFASLEGAYINANDELPRMTVEHATSFMSVVSNKKQMVNKKYALPYNTDISAVHIYATNNPPPLTKNVQSLPAWWDRWIIVPFTKIHQDIANWEEKNLTKENCEALLLVAVREMQRIITNGYKLCLMQDPAEVSQIWTSTMSPLNIFIRDNMDLGDWNYVTGKDELLQALCEFRETLSDDFERAQLPTEKTALTIKLRDFGVEPAQIRDGEARRWVYRGIRPRKTSCYFT